MSFIGYRVGFIEGFARLSTVMIIEYGWHRRDRVSARWRNGIEMVEK